MRNLILVLTVLLMPASATAAPSDPLQPDMSVLGITVAKSTPAQIQEKLGPAEPFQNGRDAGDTASTQCYQGPDGTTLVFLSTEMSGKTIGSYELVARIAQAVFADDLLGARRTKDPPCSKLKTLSRSTTTGGGLRLGMSTAQVIKLMGKPADAKGDHLVYRHTSTRPFTPEDKKSMGGAAGTWYRNREVAIDLSQGVVVRVSVSDQEEG